MVRKIAFIVLISLLFYTRFVGLSWGLPYPMHPDERNMSVAVQSLSCTLSNPTDCLNPYFFAYGQFSLYLAYFLIKLWHGMSGQVNSPTTFIEATLALRVISALASVINALVLIKIVDILIHKKTKPKIQNSKQIQNSKYKTLNFFISFFSDLTTNYSLLTTIAIIIFAPYFIQFSHFGTTESLLMLFYSVIVYLSLHTFINQLMKVRHIVLMSVISGLAVGTKVSSIVFVAVPLVTIFFVHMFQFKRSSLKLNLIKDTFVLTTTYLLLTTIFTIISSPHNIIHFQDFLGSMRYESAVGTGFYRAFYTQQFANTIPILFQMITLFPFAFGWPLYLLGLLGFFALSWRNSALNLLRFAIVVYSILSAFLYAKWTRFMAPAFPLMTAFSIIFLITLFEELRTWMNSRSQLKSQKVLSYILHPTYFILILILIIPGIAYLSIYTHPDVRFAASEWIYKNIPPHSYVLSETANVVDIPLLTPDYRQSSLLDRNAPISFDFYNLDSNPQLQQKLSDTLSTADYIFVPSRRIFANYTCELPNAKEVMYKSGYFSDVCADLNAQYPKLQEYYTDLFSGQSGFGKVAEFTSFPKLELFGTTIVEFNDENAEETWTVFDHPVIRIYKKM